jgi:hypothetical protein
MKRLPIPDVVVMGFGTHYMARHQDDRQFELSLTKILPIIEKFFNISKNEIRHHSSIIWLYQRPVIDNLYGNNLHANGQIHSRTIQYYNEVANHILK